MIYDLVKFLLLFHYFVPQPGFFYSGLSWIFFPYGNFSNLNLYVTSPRLRRALSPVRGLRVIKFRLNKCSAYSFGMAAECCACYVSAFGGLLTYSLYRNNFKLTLKLQAWSSSPLSVYAGKFFTLFIFPENFLHINHLLPCPETCMRLYRVCPNHHVIC